MDLRYEFQQILAQYGSPVLVVRQGQQLRCSCWNEKTQEANRLCPICFGIGWVPVVEKHLARSVDTTFANSLAMLGGKSPLGQINVDGRSYYMNHDTDVSTQCLLVEVDWSPTGKPIYNNGGVYEVNYVENKRFEHGEIVFKKVYCKDEPIQKHIRGIRIANVNGIINYEIAEGQVG